MNSYQYLFDFTTFLSSHNTTSNSHKNFLYHNLTIPSFTSTFPKEIVTSLLITSSSPHCSIQENQPPIYLHALICLFISNSSKSHDAFLVFIIDTKTYKTSLKYTNCVMSCKKKSTPNIIVTLGHLSHDHLIPTLLVLSGFFTLSYKKMVLSTNSEPI